MAITIINKFSSADTATLAGHTAQRIDTTMAALTDAFLLTMCQIGLNLQWHANIIDSIFIGLAYGDATIGEIATALTGAVVSRENGQLYQVNQVNERAVIDWAPVPEPQAADSTTTFMWKPRIPKGGIPCAKGDGFAIFAFNPNVSLALTDGPNINVLTKWLGTWLS